jgi:hypothetical protein
MAGQALSMPGSAAGAKRDIHSWFTQVVRCASHAPARTIFSAQ